ncbi:hypothetical protein H1235_15410 [Pseudoxanthomonas sp. NC8]|nr:hypothetical protein H1235_15410 [Pseudoxanthomonas sp. NC8]
MVERSAEGAALREADIAVDVFGRGADFDSSHDATIRVYMHRLRGRLEAFYADAGSGEPFRVMLRKGEYRLGVERHADAGGAAEMSTASAVHGRDDDSGGARPRHAGPRWPARHGLRWALAATLVVSLLGNGVALWQGAWSATPAGDPLAARLRQAPAWSGLFADERPVLLVLGDYYIFGDAGEPAGHVPDAADVRQLVRDFDVNSAADLHDLVVRRPGLGERYVNLELGYLPTSSAFALRQLLPVLAAPGRRVEVVMASQLRLDMLKDAHVVYVGFLSGMGPLRDFTFAGSRYALGRSYDELVDQESKAHYLSQAGTTLQGDAMYSDYGYVAAFPGPGGGRVLVVTGTRDVAVMHAAEVLGDPAALQELDASLPGSGDFEALYEVNGINHTSIRGRLLRASPRTTLDVWHPAADVGLAAHLPR